jgi:hypothetical protein
MDSALEQANTGRKGQAKSPVLTDKKQLGCWTLQEPTGSRSTERDTVVDWSATESTGVGSPILTDRNWLGY